MSMNHHILNKTDPEEARTNISYQQTISCASAIALFLFALVFRMIYVFQSIDNPLFGVPLVDARAYVDWASNIANGIWLWDRVQPYLPIYPAFLAIQRILFGTSPFVNKIIQSIMGSLSAIMLAHITAKIWNKKAGLIAGYLFATNWVIIVYESECFAESFCIFFQCLTIWLLTCMPKRSWAVIAAGLAFALSAGTRPNMFLLLPFIIIWLIWANWSNRAGAIKAAILFPIGTICIVGPILFRNYQITGIPLLRAQTMWNLYSGISPEFEGLHPPYGILFEKYIHLPIQAGLRSVPDTEHFWAQKAWEVVRENPIGLIVNFSRRILIFLNAREWSQEIDIYAYRGYSWFLSLPWTGFWLIGPLGLAGVLEIRRRSKEQALLILYLLVSICSIILFKGSDRYRLPSVSLLIVFAALMLYQICLWIKSWNKYKLAKALPVLIALCLLCWPDWQDLNGRKVARHNFYIGTMWHRKGKIDDAIQAYKRSMQEYGWDPESPYLIGYIYSRQEKPKLALVYLNEALRREPLYPDAMNEIARIKLKSGDIQNAEMLAHKSFKLNPISSATLVLLADIQRLHGKTAEEISFLRRAVAESWGSRNSGSVSMVLAKRLLELENYKGAIELYDHIMRSLQVDRQRRVRAAVFAGITSVRFMKNAGRHSEYWNYIINNFADFNFFLNPALFLANEIDKRTFKERMNQSPEWQASAEYIIGLKHWLNSEVLQAEEAFRRCLTYFPDSRDSAERMPQKWAEWAREDLERIREEDEANQVRNRNMVGGKL